MGEASRRTGRSEACNANARPPTNDVGDVDVCPPSPRLRRLAWHDEPTLSLLALLGVRTTSAIGSSSSSSICREVEVHTVSSESSKLSSEGNQPIEIDTTECDTDNSGNEQDEEAVKEEEEASPRARLTTSASRSTCEAIKGACTPF